MSMYTPEKLVSVSRYQNFFPTLPHDIQRDIYSRMAELIAEEKQYCDKGNSHADVINYGNRPYTDFIRTETLCQGGKLCNFRFVRHETDAGNGWERSKSI